MATAAAKEPEVLWWTEAEKAHAEQLALIAELERLTAEPKPDVARLATVRWKLSQSSRQRRALLESRIYPELERLASPADLERLKRARERDAAAMAVSARHIADWTMDKIQADWLGYGRASSAMRAAMRKRIAAERELIYLVTRGRAPA